MATKNTLETLTGHRAECLAYHDEVTAIYNRINVYTSEARNAVVAASRAARRAIRVAKVLGVPARASVMELIDDAATLRVHPSYALGN